MRYFFPLIIAMLLLSGCTIGYQPYYGPSNMLVDFPLPPHDHEVPIYFPVDTLPDEEYIRIGVLEARGAAFTPYNELIYYLQEQGRYYGVDAIQIIDKQTNETEYYSSAVLAGLGLKSLKNLDYLEQYVKSKEVYLLEDDYSPSGPWVAKLWTGFDGRVQRVDGNPMYSEIVEKHSLDYLLYEKDHHWRYANDPQGNIRMRVRSIQAVPQLRVWFTYKYQGFPSTARIRDYPTKAETLIEFEYDGYGHIVEKMIYLPNDKVLKEIPSYDADGKQVGSEYFTVVPGQPDKPYMRVIHYFYSLEDVEDRIVLK